MTYIDQLQERFPVRKTRTQKQAFRDFALEEAQRLGYDARVEQSAMGSNVVIGAGSVVVKNIPDNSVAVGNPCRVIRPITDADRNTCFDREDLYGTSF